MFWRKKSAKEEEKGAKLSGPREIPEVTQHYLVTQGKMRPDLVKLLKAVTRKSITEEAGHRIRVFDDSEALARGVQVKDYTSLDQCSDLILYEGWFDDETKLVKLEEKKNVNWNIPIFTQIEIQQKIEALRQPGDTVFFYMGRGSSHGGPLGMGAAVIELNPSYPGKKQKQYNAYRTDVIDMQPVREVRKVFDSNKAKVIARWIKEGHHKRIY
jgi:hypothetical protein